jgi:hypothetical protein
MISTTSCLRIVDNYRAASGAGARRDTSPDGATLERQLVTQPTHADPFACGAGLCRLLAALLLWIVVPGVAACATTAEPPATENRSLCGEYFFMSAACRGDPPPAGMPLLPLGDIRDRTSVYVVKLPDNYLLTAYTDRSGRKRHQMAMPSSRDATWHVADTPLQWSSQLPAADFSESVQVTGEAALESNAHGDLIVSWEYKLASPVTPVIPGTMPPPMPTFPRGTVKLFRVR